MCLAPHFFTSPFPRRIKKGKRNAQARLITLSQNGYGAYGKSYFSTSIAAEFFLSRQRSKTWIFPADKKASETLKPDNYLEPKWLRCLWEELLFHIDRNISLPFPAKIENLDFSRRQKIPREKRQEESRDFAVDANDLFFSNF